MPVSIYYMYMSRLTSKDMVRRKIHEKIVSDFLIIALCFGIILLTACGDNREDYPFATNKQEKHEYHHTLYFRDSSRSDKVVATFFNSITGESEDVEMIKCGEDAETYTFSCEGNVKKYNVAHFNYGDKQTKNFAFNRCVSGWEKTGDGFKPYTHGMAESTPSFERVLFDCNGYEKKIYVFTPEDYDENSEDKYATIYVLDGQNEVNIQNPESRPDDCWYIPEQVRCMAAETGYKAIVVAVSTYGDMTNQWRGFLGEKDFSNNTPFIYLYTGPAGGDTDPYVTHMNNRLKDMGYPADKMAFHYNENGGHHPNYWRAYFSEFLTAMAFQRVEHLQE